MSETGSGPIIRLIDSSTPGYYKFEVRSRTRKDAIYTVVIHNCAGTCNCLAGVNFKLCWHVTEAKKFLGEVLAEAEKRKEKGDGSRM